ncbi:MAG TPA: squalene/phytoene synthase family protein [Candidatus Limnocylindria bacterium]|nr:squalene/phytoene synthase family protein [Candidatus Limnocylindria bacterium]
MTASLASAITKASSAQAYYTIRFLVDRPRVEDAYRAYAYFRWVDDVLDGNALRLERQLFLERQKSLLDRCLAGDPPADADPHEAMLVALVRRADLVDRELETYLRQMMRVMEFDVRRRGYLVSRAELDEYTRRLAVAVTEALHHFMGNGAATPHDETRYMAVTGAHILHMLRDTYPDVRAGYFNIPQEFLEANSIGPADIQATAYRAWVASRVKLARACLDQGKTYYERVENRRHRVAGLAYMARFDWLSDTLEREDFRLRPQYDERRSLATGLRMTWTPIASLVGLGGRGTAVKASGAPRGGRT